VRRALVALVVALPSVLAPVASAAADTTSSPIEHLVVIVEENSTFDHTFGALPLVNGPGKKPNHQIGGGQDLRMVGFSKLGVADFVVPHGQEILSNGSAAAKTAFDHGQMDGFYEAQSDAGKNAQLSFTFRDRASVTPWQRLAAQGVVFDKYFSSSLGGSLPNTLNLVAGSSYGLDQGASTDLRSLWNSDFPTIFDAASAAGVSWRYYVGGLDQLKERRIANGSYLDAKRTTPSQLYWAPILSMRRFWEDPALSANVRNQNDFFQAAAQGNLADITYILPQPTTHEPLLLGPDLRLLSVVNALRTSPDWSSTAVLVVWDDWGGYYDHVAPPMADDGQQLGFRVPMLLLSPWADAGTVNSHLLDHSSIPALAASTFGLPGMDFRPHTERLKNLWTDTSTKQDRIVALSHPEHYVAAGMDHAPAVFILYLLTIVMITGVLFVVGVTLRGAPGGGSVP
jgi:phospholipase C